jgi:hypothetical protein
MGQAVGTLGALASKGDGSVRDVETTAVLDHLRRSGAILELEDAR